MCSGKVELESTFVCGTGSRCVDCGENHGERGRQVGEKKQQRIARWEEEHLLREKCATGWFTR